MAVDYYQLLGVSRSATPEEIKKAFRTKAHQFHPDKATGDAEKFKEINEAYQVLSDATKRQQYDQFGQTHDQARRQGGAAHGADPFGFGGFQGGNVDFGDLGDMFGDIFGFGGRQSTPDRRGRDMLLTATIPFRTAIFGGEVEVTTKRLRPCATCSGSGARAGSTATTCSTCNGRGQVQQQARTMLGVMQTVVNCPTCHGEGKIIKDRCADCQGEGRRETREPLSVKIPAGIDQGQKIKLTGQGEAGRRGGPGGDLFLEIVVSPDPVFQRDDVNLLSRQEIPISLATLGGHIFVPTIDGQEDVKISAGTQSGTVVTLRGKGVPHLRGRGRGDQLITIAVTTPEKLSAKAKKLFQQLRDEGI